MRRSVLAFALCLTASGATLERLSLDEMALRSTAIVRARAISNSTSYVGSTIYTKTRFEVLERYKGPEGSQVEVMEPGGTVGQMRQTYSGVPRFTPGQEMVLFLWTGPSGRTQVIGLSQGVFEVSKASSSAETEVTRQPSGETMLAPGSGGSVEEQTFQMPLRRLVGRIQTVLEKERRK